MVVSLDNCFAEDLCLNDDAALASDYESDGSALSGGESELAPPTDNSVQSAEDRWIADEEA